MIKINIYPYTFIGKWFYRSTFPQTGRSQVWTWWKLVLLSIIYSVFEKIKLSRLFQTEWEVSIVKGHIVIPYTQGLCESIKKICGRYGIQTHFKGSRTIKSLLVSTKDKDPMVNQSCAIYWYQCGELGCDEDYIGKTSRAFDERYKEHLKAPSAIYHHSSQTGHPTNHNNFQIIGREGHNLARNIKESIYIRVNNPTLNNNIGKFNLSHIWDTILLNTKGLTLNKQGNNNNN